MQHQSRSTIGIIDLTGNIYIDFVRQYKVGIIHSNMNKYFINCILYKIQLINIVLLMFIK